MVKLQTVKRGTHVVSIPRDMVEALGWSSAQRLALCPCQDKGILQLVPLRISAGEKV